MSTIKLSIPHRSNQKSREAGYLEFSTDTTVQSLNSGQCGEKQHLCKFKYPARDEDGGVTQETLDIGLLCERHAVALNTIASSVYKGRNSVRRKADTELIKSAKNISRRMARIASDIETIGRGLGICPDCGCKCAHCLDEIAASIDPDWHLAVLEKMIRHFRTYFDMRPDTAGSIIRGIAKAAIPSKLSEKQQAAAIARYIRIHAANAKYAARIYKAYLAVLSTSHIFRDMMAKETAKNRERLWTFRYNPQELMDGNQL